MISADHDDWADYKSNSKVTKIEQQGQQVGGGAERGKMDTEPDNIHNMQSFYEKVF